MNTLLYPGGLAQPWRWNRLVRRLGLADGAANQNLILSGYDIVERGDGDGRISLAVPGFDRDELTVEQRGRDLVITGTQKREHRGSGGDADAVLWHGYSQRAFRRVFRLGDDVEVADSQLENGLLHIDLRRTRADAGQPRRIPIARPTGRPDGHRPLDRLGAWWEDAIATLSGWWRRVT